MEYISDPASALTQDPSPESTYIKLICTRPQELVDGGHYSNEMELLYQFELS